ncbi:MAG: lyase, partial [Victivallales bacterium]|nr:lyase [Victivallales bacterium]
MRSIRIRIPVLLALTAALAFPSAVCAEILRVASSAAAQSAIDRAKPGDEIVLADGIHADFRVVLRGKGTEESPI